MTHVCSSEGMREKIQVFSQFGNTGNGGVTRYALSEEDILAKREFVQRMKAIGAVIEIDDIANIYATLPGSDPEAKRIATGSHSDSVKNGGNYDGILGVISAMEVLETIFRENIPHRHPITAVSWTNEEGAQHPPAMMASGIVCYDYLPESIRENYRYEDMMASQSIVEPKHSFGQALESSGFQGEKKYRLDPHRYQCMYELHIEQGPILENAGKDVGIVDCLKGMYNYRLRFYGQTVHAGTFPMEQRKDAFFAAAQALNFIHSEIDALGHSDLVYTTGETVCHPCVHGCVPDYFDFSFDVRHKDAEVLEEVLAVLKRCEQQTWAGCRCEIQKMWSRKTVFCDANLVDYARDAAREADISHMDVSSGAGHDAQFVAAMMPMAMIFVQSKDGLSHCEQEFSELEHCTEGATVLLNAILKADTAY